jgi:hypothetical protein
MRKLGISTASKMNSRQSQAAVAASKEASFLFFAHFLSQMGYLKFMLIYDVVAACIFV